jgi:hypothetical protein
MTGSFADARGAEPLRKFGSKSQKLEYTVTAAERIFHVQGFERVGFFHTQADIQFGSKLLNFFNQVSINFYSQSEWKTDTSVFGFFLAEQS